MKTNSLLPQLALAILVLTGIHAEGQAGAHRNAATLEQDFQAAMAAEDKGDRTGAEAILARLHKQHPGIFEIDESLGLLYAQREKYAEALPLLAAAVQERPGSDVAHANLGAALSRLHREAEALREVQRAVQLNPKNAVAERSLGELYIDGHQPDRAAEAFTSALALTPGDADLTLARARALNDAGHLDQARAAVLLLSDAARSAPAQALLGEIEEKAGNFRAALDARMLASQLEPSEENVWQVSAEFLHHWTFDAAVRAFEAAVASYPQSVRLRLGLGAAYFGNTQYAQAAPVFATLLKEDPENAAYADLLGITCTALMQDEKPGCEVLTAYAQAHPGNARVATNAAIALLAGAPTDEQKQLARTLLEKARLADPRLAEAQFRIGLLKQTSADWAGSIAPLQAAIKIKPEYAQAHYRLALAYWRTGQKQEGQAEMELQKKYSRAQADDLDRRLRQITIFHVQLPE